MEDHQHSLSAAADGLFCRCKSDPSPDIPLYDLSFSELDELVVKLNFNLACCV